MADKKELSESILDLIDNLSDLAEQERNIFIYKNINIFKSCRLIIFNTLINHVQRDGFGAIQKKIEIKIYLKLFIRQLFHYKKYNNDRKVDIVFWPTEPTHLDQQLPIAHNLKLKNISYTFATDRAKLIEVLLHKNEPVLVFTSPKNYFKWSLIKNKVKATLHQMFSIQNSFDKKYFFIILELLRKNIPIILKCINDTELLLKKNNPKIVFLGNDISIEGATAAQIINNRYGLAVSIMHGNLTSLVHKYHNLDLFFVYGENDKNILLDLGVNPKSIEISGAPYLDGTDLASNYPVNANLASLFSLSLKKPYALILLSGPGESISMEHHLMVIEYLKRISIEYSDIQFVVKLHRKDKLEFYNNYPIKHNLLISSNDTNYPESIFEWFRGCSFIITGASTAGKEALLMKIPVITMDLMDELIEIDFIDKNISLHVKNYKDLISAINDIFSQNEQVVEVMQRAELYIEDCFYKRDTASSNRVVESLSSMINQ